MSSTHFAGWRESTLDLATTLCTEGLSPKEQIELGRRASLEEIERFEAAVATVHVACMDRVSAPPEGLLERLDQAAQDLASPAHGPRTATPEPPARRGTLAAVSGWLAAAASLALWASTSIGPEPPSTSSSPAARRAALIAEADPAPLAWAAAEDPLSAGVVGDVVWDRERQEGYMRFEGLAQNDPTQAQYQLWIFDSSRVDWEARPVDGGVFDVGPGGETVVAIDPKLEVGKAALFAITLEKPGGVVVSQRERLVLTAAAL